MRALVQRVTHAQVDIDGETVGSCERGYLILLGVGADDGPDQIERLWSKIFKLRIFEDENGKTNRSLADVDGQVLIVSQFTLYANCKKGNRPRSPAPAHLTRPNGFTNSSSNAPAKTCRMWKPAASAP